MPTDSIKILIDQARNHDGEAFNCDEEAVLNAYDDEKSEPSSLAIKIFSILGGILATLAFLGFLVLAGLYDSQTGLVVFGGGLIIGAVMLNRFYKKLIIDTISVSWYLLGLFLLVFALGDSFEVQPVAILLMFIAGATLTLSQNYVLSFIAVLLFNGGLLALLSNGAEAFNIVHIYIAFNTYLLTAWVLNEAKIVRSSTGVARLYNPVRIGLIVSLLAGLVIISKGDLLSLNTNLVWLSSLITIPVIVYIVIKILNTLEVHDKGSRLKFLALTVLVLIPTTFAPSISGALVVLLLSFMVGHRTGMAFGVIGIIYFLSLYYYDLNFSLLHKSIILGVSGLIFLIIYFVVHKHPGPDEKS